MKSVLNSLLTTLLSMSMLFSQEAMRHGAIQGRLLDASTQQPLIGVNVLVVNSVRGAVTDLNGNFQVEKMAVGEYALRFSLIGYEPMVVSDVIVRSSRITFVNETLQPKAVAMNGGHGQRGLFQQNQRSTHQRGESHL